MKSLIISLLIAAAIVSGCAAVTEAGYYWGNYSNTLYEYTKNPNPESLETHAQELARIIEESGTRELKVPPGIYAELGYIEASRSDPASAASYYESEVSLYPESKPFLDRLISINKEAQ